jgi:hypothetical protein
MESETFCVTILTRTRHDPKTLWNCEPSARLVIKLKGAFHHTDKTSRTVKFRSPKQNDFWLLFLQRSLYASALAARSAPCSLSTRSFVIKNGFGSGG